MKVPERKELVQIFEAIGPREPFGSRDRGIVILFANTALRVSELSGLDVRHITQLEAVRDMLDVPRQWAKGHHSRMVPFNTAARKAVACILNFNEARGFSTALDAPLLQDRWHRRLSVRCIQRLFQKYRERAQVIEVTPHKLRHYCADRAHHRGVPPRTIQALLGHQRLETVEIYTHVSPENLRQSVGP